MADFKRKTLTLSSGKQLKLYGSSVAISKSLEIAEGYAPNILSFNGDQAGGNSPGKVVNPHNLTAEELQELADYNIQLWMNLKANLRKNGVEDARIFNHDAIRQ
jgi:hypothetical protein